MESRNRFETERLVFPSLSNFAEGLHEQLWKSFQSLSHSSIEYLQRVTDENKLLFLCDALIQFFKDLDQTEFQARVSIVKLTYIYYKNDSIYQRIRARLGSKTDTGIYLVSKSQEMISALVTLVHKHGLPK